MRGFVATPETPARYEGCVCAARRAHLPLQMRPREVGDVMCPQLAASDRLAGVQDRGACESAGRKHRYVLTGRVSEPARELPAEQPKLLADAVGDARRGVITHVTIAGERVAAIVPESVLDALRAAEDAEDAAEADASWDEPGEDIPLEKIEAELGN